MHLNDYLIGIASSGGLSSVSIWLIDRGIPRKAIKPSTFRDLMITSSSVYPMLGNRRSLWVVRVEALLLVEPRCFVDQSLLSFVKFTIFDINLQYNIHIYNILENIRNSIREKKLWNFYIFSFFYSQEFYNQLSLRVVSKLLWSGTMSCLISFWIESNA